MRSTPRSSLDTERASRPESANPPRRGPHASVIEGTTDDILRLTFDAVGHPLVHACAAGTSTASGAAKPPRRPSASCSVIGEQPGIRHFDIASAIGIASPCSAPSRLRPRSRSTPPFAVGKDDYIESLFGLRDNTHHVYGVGVDVVPSEP